MVNHELIIAEVEWWVLWSECLFLPSPSFICWNSNMWGIRRWGFWEVLRYEGGALMNGINAFLKETSWIFLTPSMLWEHSGCPVRLCQWTRKKAFTRTLPSWCLDLNFTVSRTVKNSIVDKLPSLWYLLQQPEDQDKGYIRVYFL